jgi:hypothetical protein
MSTCMLPSETPIGSALGTLAVNLGQDHLVFGSSNPSERLQSGSQSRVSNYRYWLFVPVENGVRRYHAYPRLNSS